MGPTPNQMHDRVSHLPAEQPGSFSELSDELASEYWVTHYRTCCGSSEMRFLSRDLGNQQKGRGCLEIASLWATGSRGGSVRVLCEAALTGQRRAALQSKERKKIAGRTRLGQQSPYKGRHMICV